MLSELDAQGPNQLKSLLDDVSKKTNRYIRKSWKECRKTRIELRSDGNEIVIGIKDFENTYDFQQRSSGFRRFVSFLLLISARFESAEPRGTRLLLIDEPETGLHPSSAKDLKNKLIKLGEKNLIVYATHSISMIDTENIKNNLIVSKDKENTTIKEAEEDGISPGENIYRAIGYSIYEELKKKNILLEGYTDKKTLSFFLKDDSWKDLGLCYTGGVKNIKFVISILELGNRKYFVLSDADESATREKKNMKNPNYWYIYKDLGGNAITIEDFYKEKFFADIVKRVFKNHKINTGSVLDLIKDNDRIKSIRNFLGKESDKDDNQIDPKKIMTEIKQECAKEVTQENIEEKKIKPILQTLLKKISGDK